MSVDVPSTEPAPPTAGETDLTVTTTAPGAVDRVLTSRRARMARRAVVRLAARGVRPVEDMRASMDRVDRFPRPRGAAYADAVVGGVPAIVAIPRRAAALRHVLYLHGGGYVVGSPRSHIALAARFALLCDATATVPAYRLAPEHVYPAAIDDCVAAYRALAQRVDPRSIVIAGDSAGGGAALSTLCRLRDEGDPLPGCAYLLSPWTDLTGSGESITSMVGIDPMLDAEHVVPTARQYAGDTPLDHPGVSPLFADHTGLPPMLVQTGSDELLLDDSVRLAERAAAAGVPVELDVVPGMWHVFQAFAGLVPEGTAALRRAAEFVRRTIPA